MTTARIALVTGGGSGVGRAACEALAADGWEVVVSGRRRARLDETVDAVAAAGGAAFAETVDVADPDSVSQLFERVEARHGRLDLLFNNAGAAAPAVPFDELSVDDWQRVVEVNLTGSFLCAQQAFALMRRQAPSGGRIINNGSISADAPRPSSAPYTATKHAITGLTKSISLDGRALGITCGQIDIGNAGTPMTERMADGVPQADGSLRPEPTFAVADVGRAVVFMASLPADTNVLTMTVMANAMPFVGRG